MAAAQPRIRLAEGRARLAEAHALSATAQAEAANASAELNEQTAVLLSEEAATLRLKLHAIEGSTTWRVGAPLRQFGRRYPSAASFVRRATRLAWWSVTGKLLQHLRQQQKILREADDAVPEPGAIVSMPQDDGGISPLAEVKIRIPSSAEPVVSVIVTTDGEAALTRRCLASISAHPPYVAFEVVVVDDAHPGPAVSNLADEIEGIRIVRNAGMQGVLASSNGAASCAGGDYLLFLRNTTEVCLGAIDALSDLLDTRTDVGMVGPKFLYPDGRLQEAGGIVWSDASAWNWGRNDDPNRPEYNYRRDVDYVSGAAIMVRRAVFEDLGGFDPDFATADYEDADLAFRIRACGLKVMYEPRSAVIHHEGASHGTDVATGGNAFQLRNAGLMRSRWQEVLSREHFEHGSRALRARDRARHRRVALIVDHYVPEPDMDAGSRSIMSVLVCLIDAGWVIKFWPKNRAYHETYTPALEDMGIEVVDDRWPGTISEWLGRNGEDIDHVLISRPSVAVDLLMPIIERTPAKLSFYGLDLHFARLRREAELTGNAARMREAAASERFERRLWRQFDTVIYLSEEEAETVRAMEPGVDCHSVIPYCFDSFEPREAVSHSLDILFVAGFAHHPNVHAAEFLVREVLPLVHAQMPEVRLILAGSHPSAAVRALAAAAVEVTGWISDEKLALLYEACRVAVVPLLFGAGVKGKVVEALRHGLPLVTTTTGAQGLPGLAAIVPVFDDAAEIAREILRLLRDDAGWMAQSQAQVRYAEAHFSRSAMRDSLLRALDEPSGGLSGV